MQSIAAIKTMLQTADELEFEQIKALFQNDERKGVQNLLLQKQRSLDAQKKEQLRIEKMISFDRQFSVPMVAGVDEVGRGPLAGPVVAACVVMDLTKPILYVNDSKKLSKAKREELYQQILRNSLYCAIGEVGNQIIDRENILHATFMAMNAAIVHVQNQMSEKKETMNLLLVDGNQSIPHQPMMQRTVVQGDAQSYSIACASILAKVHRDAFMEKMDKKYPGYDFASNAGYGTALHIEGIKKRGLSPIHRKSFCSHFV